MGRSQGPEGSQPASSLPAPCTWRCATAACLSNRKGARHCLSSLPAPVRGAVLYNSEDGQKEGKGLWPPGAAGTRESEEGHCSVVEVDHDSGSSLLLGYLQEGHGNRVRAHVSLPSVKGGDIRKEQVPVDLWEELELNHPTCCGGGSGALFARRLRMFRSDICNLTATGGMRAMVAGSRVTSAFMSLNSSSSCFRTAGGKRKKEAVSCGSQGHGYGLQGWLSHQHTQDTLLTLA